MPTSLPLPRPARVLLVDDEVAILDPLTLYFRGLGWDAVPAREPEEAEALLEHDTFDLVILDLALTRFGKEGLAVLSALRSRNRFLPVIVLSANIAPDVAVEADRLGADAVLSKPQDLATLSRIARGLLGASA